MADPVYDDEEMWIWKAITDRLAQGVEAFEEGVYEGGRYITEGWDKLTGTEKDLAEITQRQKDRVNAQAQSVADLNPGPAYAGIWDGGETYKPVNEYGQAVSGPFSPRAGQGPSQQSTTPEGPKTEEDYLNQLLMASLMKGRKPTYGKQAPSSYGVGATVPFGDAWRMRRTIGGQ